MIGRLTSLESLNMRHGRFTDDGLCQLDGLRRLKRLDLARTRVGDEGLRALVALPSLEVLNLDYTLVTRNGLAHLAKAERLVDLALNSSNINDDSLHYLSGLGSLRRLNLYHTFVTKQGVDDLAAQLPDCEIIWDPESGFPTRRGS